MAITTKEARTDLYAQGTGEAQVFKEQQADFMEREARVEKRRADDTLARQKKAAAQKLASAKKQKGYTDLIGKLDIGKGMPSHTPELQQGMTDLYKLSNKLIGPNGEIENETELLAAINQQQGRISQSNAARTQLSSLLLDAQKDPGKFKQSSVDDAIGFFSDPSIGGGQYTFDGLVEDINFVDEITGTGGLAAFTRANAKTYPDGRIIETTPDEAAGILAKSVSDPTSREGRAAVYEWEDASPQEIQGLKDPRTGKAPTNYEEFHAASYFDLLADKGLKQPTTASLKGTDRPEQNVTINRTTGWMDHTQGPKSDTPRISNVTLRGENVAIRSPRIKLNDDGTVDRGEVVMLVSDLEQGENKQIVARNKKTEARLTNEIALFEAMERAVDLGEATTDNKKELERMKKKYNGKPDRTDKEFKLEKEHVQRLVQLTREEARDVYFQVWGRWPEDVISGADRAGLNVGDEPIDYEKRKAAIPKEPKKPKPSIGLVGSGLGGKLQFFGDESQLSEKDRGALKWAEENPNDPKSQKFLRQIQKNLEAL